MYEQVFEEKVGTGTLKGSETQPVDSLVLRARIL